jgi:cytochrome b subunit of formate dehydrogenase
MNSFNQTGQSSSVRWVIRPAAECVKVWFWLTVILFASLLVSGAIMSAFEPSLWGGPVRHQVLVQQCEPRGLEVAGEGVNSV